MRYSLPILKSIHFLRAYIIVLFFSLGSVHAEQSVESWVWKTAVATSVGLFYMTNIMDAERMTFEVGTGEKVNVMRIAGQWEWENNLFSVFGFDLDTYWQFDYSKWQSTIDSSQRGANNTIGLTPVFRFTRSLGEVKIYLDTSVGVYLFSNTQVNDLNFGTNFQFSDALALGMFWGKRNQWSVAYKFQHLSNGSVKLPNNGINLNFLTIAYEY